MFVLFYFAHRSVAKEAVFVLFFFISFGYFFLQFHFRVVLNRFTYIRNHLNTGNYVNTGKCNQTTTDTFLKVSQNFQDRHFLKRTGKFILETSISRMWSTLFKLILFTLGGFSYDCPRDIFRVLLNICWAILAKNSVIDVRKDPKNSSVATTPVANQPYLKIKEEMNISKILVFVFNEWKLFQ